MLQETKRLSPVSLNRDVHENHEKSLMGSDLVDISDGRSTSNYSKSKQLQESHEEDHVSVNQETQQEIESIEVMGDTNLEIEELVNREQRVENWNNHQQNSENYQMQGTVDHMMDCMQNSPSNTDQELDGDRDLVIEEIEKDALSRSTKQRVINRKGRPRKSFNSNLFEFAIRDKSSNRGVCMKRSKKRISQRKDKSSVQLEEEEADMVDPNHLLNLGKELGLKPIFSDNDTLSVIIKRLRKD